MSGKLTAGAIVDDPAKIADVAAADIPAFVAQLSATAAALAARLPLVQTTNGHEAAPAGDRLLKLDEAAAILQVSVDFIRRSPSMRSVRVRLDRELRCSLAAIHELIRKNRGRE